MARRITWENADDAIAAGAPILLLPDGSGHLDFGGRALAEPQREGLHNRECERCGETMYSVRADKRTCSPACRQALYRRRL